MTRPGLNKRAVHAEVLARNPAMLVGALQHMAEQLDDRIMRQQALTVFRQHRDLHRQADEPAKQQVVLHLLHALAL